MASPPPPEALLIITPVYNDWASLRHLLPAIDDIAPQLKLPVMLCVVDDGSHIVPADLPEQCRSLQAIQRVELVHLISNQGHQRAIAVGLSHAVHYEGIAAVIVMDCDGEDRPADLPRLIAAFRKNPEHIVVASRRKRSEGLAFRLFYQSYKGLFYLLIGRAIDFGNYVLLPRVYAEKLAYQAHLWNHLAATIMRSNIPMIHVATDRGERYAGNSRMNLVALILHGLSAISVYSEVVFIRILLFSLVLIVLALLGILTVVLIRLLTALAIPGWATSTVGILVVMLIQAIAMSGGATFIMLNMRSQPSVVPAIDALKYIKAHSTLYERD